MEGSDVARGERDRGRPSLCSLSRRPSLDIPFAWNQHVVRRCGASYAYVAQRHARGCLIPRLVVVISDWHILIVVQNEKAAPPALASPLEGFWAKRNFRRDFLTFGRDAHRHRDPAHPLTDAQAAPADPGTAAAAPGGRGGRGGRRQAVGGGRVEQAQLPPAAPRSGLMMAVPTLTDFSHNNDTDTAPAKVRLALVHVQRRSLCRLRRLLLRPVQCGRRPGLGRHDHRRGVHPRGRRRRRRRFYHGRRRRRHESCNAHAVGRAVPTIEERESGFDRGKGVNNLDFKFDIYIINVLHTIVLSTVINQSLSNCDCHSQSISIKLRLSLFDLLTVITSSSVTKSRTLVRIRSS